MRRGSVTVLVWTVTALAFVVAPAGAAVQPIGSAAGGQRLGDDLFITLPFTAAAGSHRLLVVSAANGASGSTRTVSGVTFGTTALTRAVIASGGNQTAAEIWILPLGTSTTPSSADIKVTFSDNVIAFAAAQVFRGVRQTDPVTTGTSTGSSVGVLSQAGNYVADSVVVAANTGLTAIATTSQNQVRFGGYHSSDFGLAGGASHRPGSTTTPVNQPTTLTWSGTATNPSWAHAAVNLIQLGLLTRTQLALRLDRPAERHRHGHQWRGKRHSAQGASRLHPLLPSLVVANTPKTGKSCPSRRRCGFVPPHLR